MAKKKSRPQTFINGSENYSGMNQSVVGSNPTGGFKDTKTAILYKDKIGSKLY